MPQLRVKKTRLVVGAAVLVLSIVLFGAGLSAGNRPGVLVFAAFAILAALSLGLLAVLNRSLTADHGKARPGDRHANKKMPASGMSEPGAGRTGQDHGAGILSETAGELRTSVEVLQEELEEILDEEIPADKEQIESLYNETDRLRKIIDGMEQLSKAQALARSLRKVPVELEPMLKEVIERNRTTPADAGVSFSLECEPGLSMTSDPDCLAWIAGNLVDNAVRAVRDAGSVTVTAVRSGENIVFSVKDTGTGIRRSHVAHLFERFFRGSGSGIGMGLAIVKELVDACGGSIEVETGAGKGSVFTVRLPQA